MKNRGITVFSTPVLSLAIVVLLAALAGVAAAILPSPRVVKLNILRAIVNDSGRPVFRLSLAARLRPGTRRLANVGREEQKCS